MAVDLVDLMDTLQPKLNTPGTARPLFDFSNEDLWVNALASAFWTVKSKGRAVNLFAPYRINVDGDKIVNFVDGTVDMDREDQELIVLQAALTAVQTTLLALPTHTLDRAGPVETERERSSTVLRQLLEDKKEELLGALAELGAGGTAGTRAVVIDAILTRSGFSSAPFAGVFIN